MARRHIESLESWLRRIIDHQLRTIFGINYYSATLPNSQPVVPRKIADYVEQRRRGEPHRYPRWIDATQLGEAISIVLHPNLYSSYFEPVLRETFPNVATARLFLNRIAQHRNPLMHGGMCNARMLEQCVCYSNDVIESCRNFFQTTAKTRHFNAPTFTRFSDSKGNIFHVTAPEGQQNIFDARNGPSGVLYPDETLTFEVEVDESFDSSTYDVYWDLVGGPERIQGTKFTLLLTATHVHNKFEVRSQIVSKKSWHRLGTNDDFMAVLYRVLPPRRVSS